MGIRIKFLIFHILAFLLVPAAAYAGETVNASVSAEKVFVGDVFVFKVTAELPENAHISANQNIKFDKFEISDISVRRVSDVPNIYELDLRMAAYKTGLLEIEPVTVFYLNPDGTNNLFFTPQSQITVESIAGEEPLQDIKDIKAPKELKMKAGYIVLILLLAAAFIFVFVLFVRELAEKRRRANEKVLTPMEKALRELDELYSSADDIKDVKMFYYRMFEILRVYFSGKYGYDTMEMTTAEFFECAKKFLPKNITVNDFKNYLRVFNLARYAGFMPDGGQIDESYKFTKKLLEMI